MTIAEVHGKSPYVYSEDILTADVFTAFRYLPAKIGIVGFLSSIEEVANIIPAVNEDANCEFYFWPRGHYREPDVLLEVVVDRAIYHILVEAKYLSGPSDMEPFEVVQDEEKITLGNQLADQLRDLYYGEFTVFQDGVRNKRKRLSSRSEDRLLLYLTAHPVRPVDELEKAARSFPAARKRLVWSSWYHVFDYMLRLKTTALAFPFRQIVEDLLVLLDLKRFSSFHGFKALPLPGVVREDGSFWKEGTIAVDAYTGVRYPPALLLTPRNGSFWRDYRDADLAFAGVTAPSFTPDNVSGSFWMD